MVNADEAFFCNTVYNVLPAVRLNGVPIGRGVPGPVYKRIVAAWSEMVGLDIVAQARQMARV